MPYVPTWLGDIRRYFPRETVAFLEQDAIERRGLKQLLLSRRRWPPWRRTSASSPRSSGFKDMMPEETRRTARQVVAEIVAELRQRLEQQTSARP